jgi:E3 ubiquitin-protein ligase BRE1
MAAIDLEERKRPLEIESFNSTSTTSKRPHLDHSTSSSFASNGKHNIKKELVEVAEEEDDSIPAYKGLEAFRKEAIFRLMRETKRDLARSDAKVKTLQDAVDSMNERCAAFDEFWNTVSRL